MTFERTEGCAAYTGTKFNHETSISEQQTTGTQDPRYIVVGHGTPGCSQSFNF